MQEATEELPKLPGFNFDSNLGKTRFHRKHLFSTRHGVSYLFEKEEPNAVYGYSSIYPEGEEPELPPWLGYADQKLIFKAFFQETVQERWRTAFHIRLVNMTFFLEDGSMKIVEPSVDNSGLEQGVLVKRQRIPKPGSEKDQYYNILDLNIGNEPEIYGRVYKIVDCDRFTRHFLNRAGISVPDPILLPKDPYTTARREQDKTYPKKPSRTVDTLGNFLKYDRQVLRYYGYWDDTENLHGIVHDLELHYYMSDDTMEIKENVPPNSGRDSGPMFVKRMKIPKFQTGLQPIGASDLSSVLNVLGENTAHSYYMIDSLESGKIPIEYYKENELGIGAQINVFGRRIVITGMDAFTMNYYRTRYGLDDFTALAHPVSTEEEYRELERYIPPYNGFGSYDDSLGNCFTVLPKAPKMDFVKFFYHDRQGFNSHVLRFRAKMISRIPDDEERQFIIRVFLVDDTVSIFEMAKRNSGFQRALFQKRMEIMLPGQDIFTSKKPDYYKPHDFYVGARMNLSGFHFQIISADNYTLRYMELNCENYPKSNNELIMLKLRKSLQPVRDEFLQAYTPPRDTKTDFRVLTYEKLKEALIRYMGDGITEHEMITIARHYSSFERKETRTREYVRGLLHTELHRFLWCDLDRLREDLHHWDRERTGFLPRESLYTIMRGCKVPIDVQLLNFVLDHLRKSEDGKLYDYNDLLRFVNMRIDPLPSAPPINIKAALWWTSEKEPDYVSEINWCDFIKEICIDATEEITVKKEEECAETT